MAAFLCLTLIGAFAAACYVTWAVCLPWFTTAPRRHSRLGFYAEYRGRR